MPEHKPIDFLKTALNSIVLVATAVSSIINLLKGFNLPLILLTLAIALVLLLVISELRDRQKKSRATPATSLRPLAGASVPVLPAMPPETAGDAPWRWNEQGQLVLHMNRVLPKPNSTA